jgi:glycosyltransferase involved in cell wall biosynthesis
VKDGRLLHRKPKISVIVPIYRRTPQLQRLREFMANSNSMYELILVINNSALIHDIVAQHPHEIVITQLQPGRGFALKRGTMSARGEVILFLHSDTILSQNWDTEIIEQLKDPHIVGGGYSLRFDTPNIVLEYLIKLSTIIFHLTGELWGDRAIFVRSKTLRKCLSALNVPLFEDIRLSKCMRKHGIVSILNKYVTTSAASFQKYGLIQQTIRILVSRLWYALGGDPKQIYNYYYKIHLQK